MQVTVVRNDKGELLFVEALGSFVNLLTKVEQLSIGAVAKIAANDNALAVLQNSCSTLPDHLFAFSKVNAPNLNEDIDLDCLVEEQPKAKGTTSSPILQTYHMNCQGSNHGPYTCTPQGNNNCWDKAVAFRNVGDSFEMAITIPPNYSYIMLGILPDDANLQTRLRTRNVYNSYGCFLQLDTNPILYPSQRSESITNLFNNTTPVVGKEVRMRYYHESQTLECSYDGSNKWHKVNNVRGYSIEQGTVCCPVLLLCYTNYTITVTEVKSIQGAQGIGAFKTESSFLVSNELNVTDSTSFSSHLQLLKRYEISDVLTLQSDTVTFGSKEVKKLCVAILDGKRKVLEEVFGKDDK